MSTDRNVVNDCHVAHPTVYGGFRCMSWTAIIVGTLVGIGLTFLLNLFCTSINLAITTTSADGVTSLAIGGFIGFLISTIVAMFLAGMTAGCLARPFCFKRNLGILYGFTVWCLALVVTAMLLGHMGRFVTTYSHHVFPHNTVVTVVNDDVSPAFSGTTEARPTEVTVNAQKAVNTIGWGGFVLFVLFFVSALSSCIGGHCGMSCKKGDSCDYPLNK